MLVLHLVACMASSLGGEETDGVVSDPAFASWEATDASAGGDGGDSGAVDTAPDSAADLTATWTGAAIRCSHANVESACSAAPEGRGWSVGDATIDVSYATFTDGDAPCAYALDYDITGEFAAGTWTIRANGDEATVVVP